MEIGAKIWRTIATILEDKYEGQIAISLEKGAMNEKKIKRTQVVRTENDT